MNPGTTMLMGGLAVALVGALRSTWSPCGLSMLSSITPFGERARGHRYPATAAWFVVGATAGGATYGAVAALLSALVSASGLAVRSPAVLVVASATAAAGGLTDAGVFGEVLPVIRRQVDDGWLARYRPWVYGSGFGWQIGCGVATYVMTCAVFVLLVLAALTASPFDAFVLGVAFGFTRGLAVLLTSRARDPHSLRRLHGRIDKAGPTVRWLAVAVQVAVSAAAAAALSPALAAVVTLVALAAVALSARASRLAAGG